MLATIDGTGEGFDLMEEVADRLSGRRAWLRRAVPHGIGVRAGRLVRRAILSHDDGGDALSDHRLDAWVLEHRAVSVRVDVDEPWRDREPTRIDHNRRIVAEVAANRDDAPAGECDVAVDAGCAGPVEDSAIHNEHVVALTSREMDRGRCAEGEDRQERPGLTEETSAIHRRRTRGRGDGCGRPRLASAMGGTVRRHCGGSCREKGNELKIQNAHCRAQRARLRR